MTSLWKISGRKARRKAAHTGQAILGFMALAGACLVIAAILTLLFTAIEAMAVFIGINAFWLYLGLWIVLWMASRPSADLSPSL